MTRLRAAIAANPQVALFVAVAVVSRLIFWMVTDRVWEDALITVTHARNAVAGIGLTHHPGEPVTHGFTSAVSVLVPLAGEIVVSGSGIFVLKVASIVAAAITIVLGARICRRLGLGSWPTALVLLYLAVGQNHIFYGMSGMETQIAVMVLLWSVDSLMVAGPVRIGLTFGASVLTRPDFLLWVGAATLDLGARNWRGAVKALIVAGLVLLPWIVFTTLYYGSPIPNTILAKSAHFVPAPPGGDPIAFIGWVAESFSDRLLALTRTFTPFFEDTLATGAPLPLGLAFFVSIVVWILAIAGGVRTWRIPGWRAAVLFAAGFTAYRLVLLPGAYFDWYVPPHSAILIILAAAGIDGLRPLPRFDPRPAVVVVLAVLFALHLPFTTGPGAQVPGGGGERGSPPRRPGAGSVDGARRDPGNGIGGLLRVLFERHDVRLPGADLADSTEGDPESAAGPARHRGHDRCASAGLAGSTAGRMGRTAVPPSGHGRAI